MNNFQQGGFPQSDPYAGRGFSAWLMRKGIVRNEHEYTKLMLGVTIALLALGAMLVYKMLSEPVSPTPVTREDFVRERR